MPRNFAGVPLAYTFSLADEIDEDVIMDTQKQGRIMDIAYEMAGITTGSHVTIYNNELYGSVYTETMEEFFPVTSKF